MLLERAKQYETASFKGLYHFIHFMDKLKLNSGDMGAAKIIGENDNVIRIMSIHKSKGLEFPVVFLASTGKQFNLTDLNQNLLLHQELGIGVKYIDYERQVQYDTLSKAAIRNKILMETLSEEMRILYVALTRAKEKLWITGICKDYFKQKEKMLQQMEQYEKQNKKINPILIKKYKKFLDWILLVYFYENEMDDLVELKTYSKKEVLTFCEQTKQEGINIIEKLEKEEKDENKIEEIEKQLKKEYPYELSTKIPTKSSVTKIKQKEETKIEISFPIPKFMRRRKNIIIRSTKRYLTSFMYAKVGGE